MQPAEADCPAEASHRLLFEDGIDQTQQLLMLRAELVRCDTRSARFLRESQRNEDAGQSRWGAFLGDRSIGIAPNVTDRASLTVKRGNGAIIVIPVIL